MIFNKDFKIALGIAVVAIAVLYGSQYVSFRYTESDAAALACEQRTTQWYSSKNPSGCVNANSKGTPTGCQWNSTTRACSRIGGGTVGTSKSIGGSTGTFIDLKANNSDNMIRVRSRSGASTAAFKLSWQSSPVGGACLGSYDSLPSRYNNSTITIANQNSETLPSAFERSLTFWQGVINPPKGVHTFYVSCEFPGGQRAQDSVSVEGY